MWGVKFLLAGLAACIAAVPAVAQSNAAGIYYYDLVDLGPLAEEPTSDSPVVQSVLDLDRCWLNSVNGINASGDVVATLAWSTVTQGRINEDSLGFDTVACDVSDDRIVVGSEGVGAQLWEEQAGWFYPYPSGSHRPNASWSRYLGAPERVFESRGSRVEVVAFGYFKTSSGDPDPFIGSLAPSLLPYVLPTGGALHAGRWSNSSSLTTVGVQGTPDLVPLVLGIDLQRQRFVIDERVLDGVIQGAAHSLNEKGAVVGCSSLLPGGALQAYVYRDPYVQASETAPYPIDEEWNRLDLSSCAFDVNKHQFVVGSYGRSDGVPKGFIWSPFQGTIDLNRVAGPTGAPYFPRYSETAEWIVTDVRGINDEGQMAANAAVIDLETGEKSWRAVRLDPVVLPAEFDLTTLEYHSGSDFEGSVVFEPTMIEVLLDRWVPTATQSNSGIRPKAYTLDGALVSVSAEEIETGANRFFVNVWPLVSLAAGQYKKVVIGVELNGVRIEQEIFVVAREICWDQIDNDMDGDKDCDDIDCDGQLCAPFSICINRKCVFDQSVAHEVNCGDRLDNDLDGVIDCQDADCYARACSSSGGAYCLDTFGIVACEETICNDGLDNDNHAGPDCEDFHCLDKQCGDDAGAVCRMRDGRQSCVEEWCNDGRDNNRNGLIDCADPSCGGRECAPGAVCLNEQCAEIDCRDRNDNDGDHFTDCEDPDCDSCGSGTACVHGVCVEVLCNDDRSNDLDEFVDCIDPDCDRLPCKGASGHGLCIEKVCVVCEKCSDPACAGFPCANGLGICYASRCSMEQCDDGRDNDANGLTDCEDFACTGQLCNSGRGRCVAGNCIPRSL